MALALCEGVGGAVCEGVLLLLPVTLSVPVGLGEGVEDCVPLALWLPVAVEEEAEGGMQS